jgi:hypothetical protein
MHADAHMHVYACFSLLVQTFQDEFYCAILIILCIVVLYLERYLG